MTLRWIVFFVLSCAALPAAAVSEPFTELDAAAIGVGIWGVDGGTAVWGDADNDGDLDLLVTGESDIGNWTRLYRNNADHTFTAVDVGLPYPGPGTAAWGDCDSDGDLDLLLIGNNGLTPAASVFRNDGDLRFSDTHAGLFAFGFGAAVWGDYDNDGDLDIAVHHWAYDFNLGSVLRIYRNDGAGGFSDSGVPFPTFLASSQSFSIEWGDCDGDGDLDLLTSNGAETRLFRNDGNGCLEDAGFASPAFVFGDVGWGDYDNDGALDILVAGHFYSPATPVSVSFIYRNNRDGTFADQAAGFGVEWPHAGAWGDYDNDGWLDAMVSGMSGIWPEARMLSHAGSGVFAPGSTVPGIYYHASLAWGDYDDDGDLDVVQTGDTGRLYEHPRITRLLRNNAALPNTPPAAPSSLRAYVGGTNDVTLTWAPGADAETAAAGGLSYNLRVGRMPGAQDVMSAQADPLTGRRLLPARGNAGQGTCWRLRGLAPGFYYWSVQSVDTALAGSPFAAESSFAIPALTEEPILDIRRNVQGRLEIALLGEPERVYQFMFSAELSVWTPRGTARADPTGRALLVEDGPARPQGFYRAHRVP